MSRTLFDLDEKPESQNAERQPHAARRTAIVPVRLTEAERDQLADLARDLGISLSTYIRQVVLARPLPPRRAVRPIPEVNRETYHELGKVGADLNVIARRWAERRREAGTAEVLKMGTYVGSCLGLGGGLSYSAAAALLDINKQVLYARNEQGAVIARQLLAISDKDELVPFAVYPESAAPAVQRAFDRYDTELASALCIARVDPTQAYDIENVLSQEWWDDGAWDPGPLRDANPSRRKRKEHRESR